MLVCSTGMPCRFVIGKEQFVKIRAKWNRSIPPAPVTIRKDLAIPKRKAKSSRSNNLYATVNRFPLGDERKG